MQQQGFNPNGYTQGSQNNAPPPMTPAPSYGQPPAHVNYGAPAYANYGPPPSGYGGAQVIVVNNSSPSSVKGIHGFRAYLCCPYKSNSTALDAIGCFFTCQIIIDIIFAIFTFAIFFRIPSEESAVKGTFPTIVYIYIIVWHVSTLVSIISNIVARCSFSNGGKYGSTKFALVFATISNSFGTLYYIAYPVAIVILAYAVSTVNTSDSNANTAINVATGILVLLAIALLPIFLLYLGQLIASCAALSQVSELPGGPNYKQVGTQM
jgi:hypothetical protein